MADGGQLGMITNKKKQLCAQGSVWASNNEAQATQDKT
jgi:hypothetical protein